MRKSVVGRQWSVVCCGSSAVRCPGTANDGPRTTDNGQRTHSGFTLTELLVVITIMAIIVTMTVTAVNFTLNEERVRGGARQVQSYLEGARDRAIYADAQRGVRFQLNPDVTNATGRPFTINSMVYIQPTDPPPPGDVVFDRRPGVFGGGQASRPDIVYVRQAPPAPPPAVPPDPTRWWDLKQKGLLIDGARIKIPADDKGIWYTVQTDRVTGAQANEQVLELTTPLMRTEGAEPLPAKLDVFRGGTGSGITGPQGYKLELPPAVMPNQEPSLLPQGVIIDLEASRKWGKIPSAWFDTSNNQYTSRMDVLFTPRGTAIGPAASQGVIHLVLAEQTDAESGLPLVPNRGRWNGTDTYSVSDWVVTNLGFNGFYYKCLMGGTGGTPPNPWPTKIGEVFSIGSTQWQAFEKHENVIVTLFTKTGSISAHPVYTNDVYSQSFSPPNEPDPFRYAETGEVAAQ